MKGVGLLYEGVYCFFYDIYCINGRNQHVMGCVRFIKIIPKVVLFVPHPFHFHLFPAICLRPNSRSQKL